MNMYGYPYMGHEYGFFGFLGGVVSFVFWVIVIIFVIKLIKRGRHHHDWRKMWSDRGAMGVLRERFAKGEISKEEYEEKKKVLEQ